MKLTIIPKKLNGVISATPSKSMAHRFLICSAFADKQTDLLCPVVSADIEATADCLRALGAQIRKTDTGYHITPINMLPDHAVLPCSESGSTLRFLLPVVGALGIDAVFTMTGRLPQRPLEPLIKEMSRMGCNLQWIAENALHCQGKLNSGTYVLPGDISSQYITGLLFACTLLNGKSSISVTGKLESKPYVDMTLGALSLFGVSVTLDSIIGSSFRTPGAVQVEGDWSSSACFFTANVLGSKVEVSGLKKGTCQGDREISDLLCQLEQHASIDVSNIPDLVPLLAIAAAAKQGAVFHNIGRLRLKESDRVTSILSMLDSLGCHARETEKTLTVFPGSFHAGIIDTFDDHRIAMAAAIAATCADGPVTVIGAECVNKSYPGFWGDYRKLGGEYEQHIR